MRQGRDIPLILLLCAVDSDGREVALHQELVQLLGPGHRLHEDDHLHTASGNHHNDKETGALPQVRALAVMSADLGLAA